MKTETIESNVAIKLTALESFLGPDGGYLVKPAGQKDPYPADYFHPQAYSRLEEFKEQHGIMAPVWQQLKVDVGGIREGRSLYNIGQEGALFVKTDIRDAHYNEILKEQKAGRKIYHGHLGIQTLTFMGTETLRELADQLFMKYESLTSVHPKMIGRRK